MDSLPKISLCVQNISKPVFAFCINYPVVCKILMETKSRLGDREASIRLLILLGNKAMNVLRL